MDLIVIPEIIQNIGRSRRKINVDIMSIIFEHIYNLGLLNRCIQLKNNYQSSTLCGGRLLQFFCTHSAIQLIPSTIP